MEWKKNNEKGMWKFYLSLRMYQKLTYAKNFLFDKVGPEEMLNTINDSDFGFALEKHLN